MEAAISEREKKVVGIEDNTAPLRARRKSTFLDDIDRLKQKSYLKMLRLGGKRATQRIAQWSRKDPSAHASSGHNTHWHAGYPCRMEHLSMIIPWTDTDQHSGTVPPTGSSPRRLPGYAVYQVMKWRPALAKQMASEAPPTPYAFERSFCFSAITDLSVKCDHSSTIHSQPKELTKLRDKEMLVIITQKQHIPTTTDL